VEGQATTKVGDKPEGGTVNCFFGSQERLSSAVERLLTMNKDKTRLPEQLRKLAARKA
jgi:hypothetical protein